MKKQGIHKKIYDNVRKSRTSSAQVYNINRAQKYSRTISQKRRTTKTDENNIEKHNYTIVHIQNSNKVNHEIMTKDETHKHYRTKLRKTAKQHITITLKSESRKAHRQLKQYNDIKRRLDRSTVTQKRGNTRMEKRNTQNPENTISKDRQNRNSGNLKDI